MATLRRERWLQPIGGASYGVGRRAGDDPHIPVWQRHGEGTPLACLLNLRALLPLEGDDEAPVPPYRGFVAFRR